MYLSDIKKKINGFPPLKKKKKGLPGDQRLEGQNSFQVCMPVCFPIATSSSSNDTLVSGVVNVALRALQPLPPC